MPQFDIEGARKAGYSEDEILQHLTDTRKFDVGGALKSGYSKGEIIQHLAGAPAPAAAPGTPEWAESRKQQIQANSVKYGVDKPAPPEKSWTDHATDLFKGAVTNTLEGLYHSAKRVLEGPQTDSDRAAALAMGPLGPLLTDIARSHVETADKAVRAAQTGDASSAVGYGTAAVLPGVGPAAAATAEKIGEGKIAEGLGEAAVLLAPMIKGVRDAKVTATVRPAVKSKLNPVESASVVYADQAGIPVPLSIRTGNKMAQKAETRAQSVLGSSGYAEDAVKATSDALKAKGAELADQVYPNPTTPEDAGTAVRSAIAQDLEGTGKQLADKVHPTAMTPELAGQRGFEKLTGDVKVLDQKANDRYKIFHEAENNPANTIAVELGKDEAGKPVMKKMALPVDMQDVQTALEPLVQRFEYTMTPTDQRASLGLKALRNIVDGPRFKPASAAELDLGMLKEAARSEMPELRDMSQGLAAKAVQEFQTAIDNAVSKAADQNGQNVLAALQEGRKLTAMKHEAADFMKRLSGGKKVGDVEPVQVFNRLTWGRDTGIQQLREMADRAPDKLPEIGRAYIDSGGKWDALGPESKKLLFKDPQLIQDLDNYYGWKKQAAPLTELEPVDLYNRLTQAGDSKLELVRDVKKKAPGEMPKVARAYVQGILEDMTRTGNMEKVDSAFNHWHDLGTNTKHELFGNPMLVSDLDNFFMLAKRIAKNPNPSGTASLASLEAGGLLLVQSAGAGFDMAFGTSGGKIAAAAAAPLYFIGNAALARMLFSPKASRALTQALKIKVNSPAAPVAAAQILKLAGKDAQPVTPEQHSVSPGKQ